MKSIITILTILFFTVSGSAAVIELPVPRSQIHFPANDLTETSNSFHFEMGVTTWAPSQLRNPSRLANTSEYKPLKNMNFKIEMGKTFYSAQWFSLLALGGFTHFQLERSGQLNSGATTTEETEVLNVFQVPLSLQVLGVSLLTAKLHPLIKVSLSPTYSRSTTGPFTKGVSELNWVGNSSVGASFDLPKTMSFLHFNDWSVAAGIETSQSLDSSHFNGTGFWISVGSNWK